LQADLNAKSPASRYYGKDKREQDGLSKTYISLEPNKTLLDTLTISFKDYASHPYDIRAVFYGENTLYQTWKVIDYRFKNANDFWVLEEFSVKGWQRMSTKDTSRYEISGKVLN
jgi:hypothetical protein